MMTAETLVLKHAAPPLGALAEAMPDMLKAALAYAAKGWKIHPLKPGEKTPLTKWETEATTNPVIIRQWWAQWPNANIGLVCGDASGGVLCFDFDKPEAFEEWRALVGDLAQLGAMQTTGNGKHFVFRCDDSGRNRKLARTETGETLIETRANGGYIMAAPSLHPNGQRYTVTQKNLATLPRLKPAEVAKLLGAAVQLDRTLKPEAPPLKEESVNPFASLVRPAAAIAATPPRPVDWLTKGFIERGELVLLTAPGGSMKSLLMLDWAVCVAAGLAWLTPQSGPGGLACSQDRVLWVNTDNSEATHAGRLRAVMLARGLKDCALSSLTTTEFELAKPDHIRNLTTLADDLGARVLVIDTLSGALTGIDENAAQQMTLPAANLRAMADMGLTVLAIHHPPKNDSNGSRGSSVLPNKVDRVYTVARPEGGLLLTVKAQKTRNTPPANITPLAGVEADHITEALLSVRFWDGRAALQDRANDDLREKILEVLEGEANGLSQNTLAKKAKVAKTNLTRAISPMLTAGEIVMRDGPNKAKIYSLPEN